METMQTASGDMLTRPSHERLERLVMLGFFHLAQGSPQKACEFFRMVLVADPADPDAAEGLARAEGGRGA